MSRYEVDPIWRQRGFNLVEMLVALAVGMILFVGLGQVFVTTKHSSITHEETNP